jgi:hypothetical protein
LISSLAHAQVPATTCVALANTIASGYSTSFSQRQFDALRYYANCEASDTQSSGGLNIGYAAFSLGAKYDKETSKQYCSKSMDSYNISTVDYNSAKIIFTQALATIDKCLDAAKKGWDIKYEQISPDAVSITISDS